MEIRVIDVEFYPVYRQSSGGLATTVEINKELWEEYSRALERFEEMLEKVDDAINVRVYPSG